MLESLLEMLLLLLLLSLVLLLLHELVLLMRVLDLHLLDNGFPVREQGKNFIERERLHVDFVLAHRHGHVVDEVFHPWHGLDHFFKLAYRVK